MLNRQEHQKLMLSILKDIFMDTRIAHLLGFKGGTCLYFAYELPRFSVDLDFDLLVPEEENLVFEKISSIMKKHGTIKTADNKRVSMSWSISYGQGLQKLFVEISKRNFYSRYELKNILGLSIQIMQQEDIFANKLIAALERKRTAIRDFYDINFMFNKFWNYNPKIIQERSQKNLKVFFQDLIDLVERYDRSNILSEIGSLLSEKDKIYVKERLLVELTISLKNEIQRYEQFE
ncbi:MAG: nucleotidyl transferase AbiEii/AbiGii toxin family protein [Candidatus Caenarcaniphilales bacterium]|nr:nucleotidyl transferase AbiEii/AbiGii toxin family protein [Candidatus Caenarcaniphilales bacterium]